MSLIAATGRPQLATGPQKCCERENKNKVKQKQKSPAVFLQFFLSHSKLEGSVIWVKFQKRQTIFNGREKLNLSFSGIYSSEGKVKKPTLDLLSDQRGISKAIQI